MKKIIEISGKTIPLAMNDVDTDLIIPAQHLTAVSRDGYGPYLFQRLRTNPDFIFNKAEFKNSNILITQKDFGCGSSREHAVWALQQAGIEAIIAISFSDIFFSNSAKNGLVLITLPESAIKNMLEQANSGNYNLLINLESEKIISNKNEEFNFKINPFHKYCFINGLDELDYLLSNKSKINKFKGKIL